MCLVKLNDILDDNNYITMPKLNTMEFNDWKTIGTPVRIDTFSCVVKFYDLEYDDETHHTIIVFLNIMNYVIKIIISILLLSTMMTKHLLYLK